MDTMIRRMERSELEEVRMLDARIIAGNKPLCRKQSSLAGYYERNPSGCFVAEEDA